MAASKIFFASDFHLGMDARTTSVEREKMICRWMDQIAPDCKELYLLGDVYDCFFEYKQVIPKGFSRFHGKLAEYRDAGIHIEFFTGNHDQWMMDYYTQEFGILIHREPVTKTLFGKVLHLGHGDGLGPGDQKYKMMKAVFMHPFSRFIYRWLHPDLGMGIAKFFSKSSREQQHHALEFLGSKGEWLIQYMESQAPKINADYYIFGHRHLPIVFHSELANATYINLGDWFRHQSYAWMDSQGMHLAFFENADGRVYP